VLNKVLYCVILLVAILNNLLCHCLLIHLFKVHQFSSHMLLLKSDLQVNVISTSFIEGIMTHTLNIKYTCQRFKSLRSFEYILFVFALFLFFDNGLLRQ